MVVPERTFTSPFGPNILKVSLQVGGVFSVPARDALSV